MSRRKPMAALAAATAALALAVPASGASAAPPVARTAGPFGAHGPAIPGSLPCQSLIRQVRFSLATGNTPLANVFSNVFIYSGCGGAAI
jgi:hypothetical protein